MIEFENVTNRKNFSEMIASGKYDIIQGKKEIEICHHLYSEPYIYGLQRINDNEFYFYSKNDEFFACDFLSIGNKITILQGEKNNRKCKADRTLKQFMRILCLANSVLQFVDYNI